jgi:hypothetical protein
MTVYQPPPIQRDFAVQVDGRLVVDPVWAQWLLELSRPTAGSGALVEAFPVGGIYVTVDNTDPGLTLGYGTWERFAEGRFLVGYDALDPDFDTPEEEGGNKTVVVPCC